jgi:hypothetical protein
MGMTRIQEALETYDAAYDAAQRNYGGRLDETDHSGLILPGDIESFDALRREAERKTTNIDPFKPVDIQLGYLAATEALYVNRPLLVKNRLPGIGLVYSPAVITKKMDHHSKRGEPVGAEYFLTKIMQPFDPEVGASEGIHLGISLASQTRAGRFGGHGEDDIASGFEQGHFLATAIGAHNADIGKKIVQDGHKASGTVINAGVIDLMSGGVMLDIAGQRTQKLDTSSSQKIRLYWHEKLDAVRGDMRDATKLAIGGAMLALGENGQERVDRLIDDAVKEKNEKRSHGNHRSH